MDGAHFLENRLCGFTNLVKFFGNHGGVASAKRRGGPATQFGGQLVDRLAPVSMGLASRGK